MGELGIAFVIFVVWGISDYFSIKIAFDEFFIIENSKNKDYKYIWLVYYILVSCVYCISKYMNISSLFVVFYFLYYMRMVPFLWSKYGVKIKVPIVVFFYEEIQAVFSSNITILLCKISDDYKNKFLIDDFCVTIVSVIFLIILLILLYFRRSRTLNIWFANLTVIEYIHLVIIIYILGNIEALICLGDWYNTFIQASIVILTFLIIMLIVRIMVVHQHNYSMANTIDILEEQIKKIVGYYDELNQKELKLKQFRHDQNNMLIALHSYIEKGKYERALQYIKKLETMYHSTTNSYDTGNFVADALLSSKARTAEQIKTKIDVNGIIPAQKIDDVDMVIFLSNILDNAIEACEKIKGEKVINIESVLNAQMWILTVKNPVNRKLNVKNNYMPTSKENKDIHGYGLANMERVVKNYDGVLKLQCENNEFIVRATFMINK